MTTQCAGIDYGAGQTNRDKETGIRFGVIPANDVGQAWFDSAEPDYGKPHCPYCGNEAIEYHVAKETLNDDLDAWPIEPHECDDFACLSCKRIFGSESAFGDSPIAWTLDDGEYKAEQGGEDCDVFILYSPFYTFAQFCSPCAPGACYLPNPLDGKPEANKCYCFGHDWFDGGKAPYPVYSVQTGELVQPE